MTLHDLHLQRLRAISARIEVLLRRSRDPQGEMREAAHRLLESGLSDFQPDQKTGPAEFAANAIENNPLMYQRVSEMVIDFHPQLIDSLDEMVSLLLPSEGDR